MAIKKEDYVVKDGFGYRLDSVWDDGAGNWSFGWQSKPVNPNEPNEDGELPLDQWVTHAFGDMAWAQRMSAHYQIKITGEFPGSTN